MNINHLYLNNKEPFFLIRHQKEIGRIATIALPFIAMYKPAAKIAMPLLHLHQASLFAMDVKKASATGKREDLVAVAFNVSLFSLSILFPSAYLFLDLSYGFISHLKGFKEEINKEGCSKNALFIHLSDAIYCAVNLTLFAKPNKPELLMVSFVVQSLQKALIALKEYDKEHYLELIANSALSLIKLKSFHYYAEISYRNRFGKTVTQKDLDLLLENLEKSEKSKIPKEKSKPESDDAKVDKNRVVKQEAATPISNFFLQQFQKLELALQNLTNTLSNLQRKLLRLKKKKSLSEELKRFNYKGNLKDLTFEGNSVQRLFFQDLVFSNVTFKNVSVKKCSFTYVTFDHCQFLNGSLLDCIFSKSNFNDSLIQEIKCQSIFYKCLFNNTRFIKLEAKNIFFLGSVFNWVMFRDSNLKRAGFDDTKWKNSHIFGSNLKEAVFFGAKAENSSIEKSILKNTLLLDAKDEFSLVDSHHQMSKRIIGLIYDFEGVGSYTKAIEKAAKKLNAVVFRISSCPLDLDEKIIEEEVTQLLKENDISEGKISQFFIKESRKFKELGKIKETAERAASYCEGIIFPGGDDIPEEFYKAEVKYQTFRNNYPRILTEIYALNTAKTKKIPCLLICRGVQFLNVYHGGTLKNVKNHWEKEHALKINPRLDTKTVKKVKEILQGSSINVHSMHNQAIDKVGKGLIVAMLDKKIPELVISNEKVPLFVGTQFHPEYYQWGDKKKFGQNKAIFNNLKKRIEFYANN